MDIEKSRRDYLMLFKKANRTEYSPNRSMLQFPLTLFSDKEVSEFWNNNTELKELLGEKFPRPIRRKNPRGMNKYTFDADFYTAWDENKLVAYSGWQENNGFFVLAGASTHPNYRKLEIASKLQAQKHIKFGDGPAIGLFNNKSMSQDVWTDSFRRKGWIINPKNPEEYYDKIPKEVIDYHIKKAKDTGMEWGVLTKQPFTKAWNIIKGFKDE